MNCFAATTAEGTRKLQQKLGLEPMETGDEAATSRINERLEERGDENAIRYTVKVVRNFGSSWPR